MPAATTHVEFARDVLALLDKETAKQITDLKAYYLGSQGPDFLFFSRASVLPGSLKKHGNLLHDEKVLQVIRYFESRCAADDDLWSYFLGYLCHYSLDSVAHPLVFAVAKYEHDLTGIDEGESHVTLEAHIDAWLLHQKGRTIDSYDVYKDIRVRPKTALKIARLYHEMYKDIFSLDIPVRTIFLSVYEVSFLLEAMSPGKHKNTIVRKAESLAGMPHSISGMFLYGKSDITIINLEHRRYPLRKDPERFVSDSFPELYGRAVTKALKILPEREDSDFSLNFEGEEYGQED
ncbi:MAG: zinc dependent phospholipase C family protein [Solobacterium sp.]|nr:zinc dependent phospholipase C family protein [Solobacterium sp.]